ncbi:MAG: recombinase family protein [Desulfovibrio sp.]|nr:recombinase family protein [Desulfovibrio sp.]
MIAGYARVSTHGQARDGNSLEGQEAALRSAGATEIFSDAFTGTKASRSELDRLLSLLQEGDTLIVTKFDRVARSLVTGIELIDSLSRKGVTVNVLNMRVIDDSPVGRLLRNVMLSFAEYEREMILERTQEGKRIPG